MIFKKNKKIINPDVRPDSDVIVSGTFGPNFIKEYLDTNKMIAQHHCTMNKDGIVLHYPNTVKDETCPDCSCCCTDGTCNCPNSRKNLKNYPDPVIKYKFNNESYRSDDFDKNLTFDNFLFSGCSLTFGTGLPYQTTWAYQLNKALGKNKFFNLGINGACQKVIIYDIYKYIKKYGKPKGIFVLFPDVGRAARFIDTGKTVEISTTMLATDPTEARNVLTQDVLFFDFFNMITALEEFLNTLNIPFIWATWHPETEEILDGISDQFKNYLSLNYNKNILEIENNTDFENTIYKKYWNRARDIIHLGIESHVLYKNLFLIEYNKKYGN